MMVLVSSTYWTWSIPNMYSYSDFDRTLKEQCNYTIIETGSCLFLLSLDQIQFKLWGSCCTEMSVRESVYA